MFRQGQDPEPEIGGAQAEQILADIYTRGDSIMRVVILVHALLALCLAGVHGTWPVTLTVTGAVLVTFFFSVRLLPRRLLTRCIAGIALQTFVLLHIFQMHGLEEMHFFYFTSLTLLIVYQDWRCLWPGALLMILQHTAFAVLANSGRPIYLFEQPYINASKLAFHFGIAVAQAGVCGYWAFLLRRRTLQEAGQQARLQQFLEEAVERADRDPLTGLLNHCAFHKRLKEESTRAQREGASWTIAIMDLNNFRFFNDAHGHLAGNQVLRLVADTLQGICRPGDSLARYGSDEFALLMPGLGPDAQTEMSARIQSCVEALGYEPEEGDSIIPLRLSVGLASFPQEGLTRSDALAVAAERLLHAKTYDERAEEAERLRSRMNRSVEGFSMLDALVTAVDNKDRYTRRHSEDVMRYSLQIAQQLGLDETAQRQIMIAALLHDVGKIGVPDAILRKPGKLNEDEYHAVQHHPMMGAVIVGAVPGFEETLDAVRHHHERWDGDGYPFGLHGEETPQLARIMAVADAFSAMTTDRPYHKGMAPEQACTILEDGAGTQWDPQCVGAFLRAQQATPTGTSFYQKAA